MRSTFVSAIAMAVSLAATSAPAGAIQARADLAGVSDVYAFTASVTVSSVIPSNASSSAWWEGGSTTYAINPGTCVLAYSDPNGTSTEQVPPCSISGSFTVPSALVCGSGLGSATGGLTLNEFGGDADTTTVSSYTASISAGAAVLAGSGTETDSGAAVVVAAFTMIPFPLTTPSVTPLLGGPCAHTFLAVGTIAVAELA